MLLINNNIYILLFLFLSIIVQVQIKTVLNSKMALWPLYILLLTYSLKGKLKKVSKIHSYVIKILRL